jgi:cell wall-associated NlpC family hydrolase
VIGELATFLDMQYVYDNAPHRVSTIDAAKKDGLNCETLTHLLLQKLGINLAPEMRAKEIYEDTKLFQPVSPEDYKLGDIFFFGRKNENDPKRLHLAVFTGNFDQTGDPLLIHANWYDRGVSIWPLGKFAEHKRYEELHTVKRYDPAVNQ